MYFRLHFSVLFKTKTLLIFLPFQVQKLQQKVQNSMMITSSDHHQGDSSPKRSRNIKISPRKCSLINSVQKNYHPLRVQNLQMKLRKDDIVWE